MPRRSPGRAQKKLFYKIGEVCELTDTEPYVLRYWESEFPFLAPEKNRAGQRIYTEDDIATVQAIKRLLYEEGYTTAGARRRLEKELAERRLAKEPSPATGQGTVLAAGVADADLKQALARAREGLREIQEMLGRVPEGSATRGSGKRASGSARPEKPAAGAKRPPVKKKKAAKPASGKASSRKSGAKKGTKTRPTKSSSASKKRGTSRRGAKARSGR